MLTAIKCVRKNTHTLQILEKKYEWKPLATDGYFRARSPSP